MFQSYGVCPPTWHPLPCISLCSLDLGTFTTGLSNLLGLDLISLPLSSTHLRPLLNLNSVKGWNEKNIRATTLTRLDSVERPPPHLSHIWTSLSQSHHCLPFSSRHCWALPPLACNLWSFLSVSSFSYLTHFCTLSHSQFLSLSCTINQFWITHLLLLSVLHFLVATEDAVNFLPSLALSSSILCLIESDAICILRGHWDI